MYFLCSVSGSPFDVCAYVIFYFILFPSFWHYVYFRNRINYTHERNQIVHKERWRWETVREGHRIYFKHFCVCNNSNQHQVDVQCPPNAKHRTKRKMVLAVCVVCTKQCKRCKIPRMTYRVQQTKNKITKKREKSSKHKQQVHIQVDGKRNSRDYQIHRHRSQFFIRRRQLTVVL